METVIKFTDLQAGDRFKSTNPDLSSIIGTVRRRTEHNEKLWSLTIEYDNQIHLIDSHNFVWNKNCIKIIEDEQHNKQVSED